MRRFTVLIVITSFLIVGCAPSAYVKYEKEAEISGGKELEQYLANSENPSIALLVPNSENDPNEENSESSFSSLYALIEKELKSGGFEVRDRELLNYKTSKCCPQSLQQKQRGIDLILKVDDIDPKVEYTTNTYYTNEGKQKTFREDYSISAYGTKVEFWMSLTEINKYVAIYEFYHPPCPDKCPIEIGNNRQPRFVNKKEEEEENSNPYQYVSKSSLESFIKDVTQQLIEDMGNK